MVEDINLLLVDEIRDKMKVDVKTRYSTKSAEAEIVQEENRIKVEFIEEQRALTPGQSAVFYLGDVVLRWRKDNVKLIPFWDGVVLAQKSLKKLQKTI